MYDDSDVVGRAYERRASQVGTESQRKMADLPTRLCHDGEKERHKRPKRALP